MLRPVRDVRAVGFCAEGGVGGALTSKCQRSGAVVVRSPSSRPCCAMWEEGELFEVRRRGGVGDLDGRGGRCVLIVLFDVEMLWQFLGFCVLCGVRFALLPSWCVRIVSAPGTFVEVSPNGAAGYGFAG